MGNIKTELEAVDAFAYCPLTDEAKSRSARIRIFAVQLAKALLAECPDSRERSLALTKLEEAAMWANKAIAVNETEKPTLQTEQDRNLFAASQSARIRQDEADHYLALRRRAILDDIERGASRMVGSPTAPGKVHVHEDDPVLALLAEKGQRLGEDPRCSVTLQADSALKGWGQCRCDLPARHGGDHIFSGRTERDFRLGCRIVG